MHPGSRFTRKERRSGETYNSLSYMFFFLLLSLSDGYEFGLFVPAHRGNKACLVLRVKGERRESPDKEERKWAAPRRESFKILSNISAGLQIKCTFLSSFKGSPGGGSDEAGTKGEPGERVSLKDSKHPPIVEIILLRPFCLCLLSHQGPPGLSGRPGAKVRDLKSPLYSFCSVELLNMSLTVI